MPDVLAIEAKRLSKWYGSIQGVSDISWSIKGGAVGLLGPNGAGKSTFMKMVVGLMRPSRGSLRIYGSNPFTNVSIRSKIAYCPEHENIYTELNAIEFVTAMARLSGVANPKEASIQALVEMGLKEAMGRKVSGFSKGMRQRTKLATCMVHNPDLVVLDEPLTGIDPVERHRIITRIRQMADQGKCVLISSHVLHEVEAITQEIMVIHRGQVLAEGNLREVRKLVDQYPHRIRVECNAPRILGQELATAPHIMHMHFDRDTVLIETTKPDCCYDLISKACIENKITLRSLTSPDNNLEAVFEYLMGERR